MITCNWTLSLIKTCKADTADTVIPVTSLQSYRLWAVDLALQWRWAVHPLDNVTNMHKESQRGFHIWNYKSTQTSYFPKHVTVQRHGSNLVIQQLLKVTPFMTQHEWAVIWQCRLLSYTLFCKCMRFTSADGLKLSNVDTLSALQSCGLRR